MKTITMLAAAAALVAGVSFASAQNSAAPAKDKAAAAGSGAFCLVTKSGPKNCTFADLASCQKAGGGKSASCTPNENSATTGSKQ